MINLIILYCVVMYLVAIGMIYQGLRNVERTAEEKKGILVHFIFSPLLTPIILGMLIVSDD